MTRYCAPRRHAVREALLGLQRPVLQQLCRQWPGVGIGNDLIVVAMHITSTGTVIFLRSSVKACLRTDSDHLANPA